MSRQEFALPFYKRAAQKLFDGVVVQQVVTRGNASGSTQALEYLLDPRVEEALRKTRYNIVVHDNGAANARISAARQRAENTHPHLRSTILGGLLDDMRPEYEGVQMEISIRRMGRGNSRYFISGSPESNQEGGRLTSTFRLGEFGAIVKNWRGQRVVMTRRLEVQRFRDKLHLYTAILGINRALRKVLSV